MRCLKKSKISRYKSIVTIQINQKPKTNHSDGSLVYKQVLLLWKTNQWIHLPKKKIVLV